MFSSSFCFQDIGVKRKLNVMIEFVVCLNTMGPVILIALAAYQTLAIRSCKETVLSIDMFGTLTRLLFQLFNVPTQTVPHSRKNTNSCVVCIFG